MGDDVVILSSVLRPEQHLYISDKYNNSNKKNIVYIYIYTYCILQTNAVVVFYMFTVCPSGSSLVSFVVQLSSVVSVWPMSFTVGAAEQTGQQTQTFKLLNVPTTRTGERYSFALEDGADGRFWDDCPMLLLRLRLKVFFLLTFVDLSQSRILTFWRRSPSDLVSPSRTERPAGRSAVKNKSPDDPRRTI